LPSHITLEAIDKTPVPRKAMKIKEIRIKRGSWKSDRGSKRSEHDYRIK